MKVWLAVAAVAVMAAGCSGKTPEEKCNDKVSAFVMSQHFVKQRLKSPSTAEFPYISNEKVVVINPEQCTHEVVAFVDSQNGFGATVRTSYYAKLKNKIGTDEWSLLDFGFVN